MSISAPISVWRLMPYTTNMSTAVEQIKERLTIEEVVGEYVELHRAGKSYKGKSPFANERTPSFYVSPDRGMYYCFSTNQGGDIFSFIQTIEGVDFKGALKILAEKAGVELVKEDPKKRSARERQYALIEEAAQFFFQKGQATPHVVEYLGVRGAKTDTVHGWRIGFAPDAWRDLRTHLTEKGYTDAEMLAAGLIKKPEGGKEPYDVFRNRVMFPISDPSGRVIAFSGRTLSDDPKQPKYVNSPETELFKKSEIMYGYDKAKQGIRQFDFSLIVEGQFDVVLSHQAGYTNTVAVSGTAFTEHHIALLQRLSNRAVLAFDSDKAGVAAAKKAAAPMLAKGMDVKVAAIEGGKDPADIVRDDPKALKRMVGGSMHVVSWLCASLQENVRDERAFKLAVRDEVLPLLVSIPDAIDREHFEQEVADVIKTTKDAVHMEVARILKHHAKESEKTAPEKAQVVPEEAEVPIAAAHTYEALARHLMYFASLLAVIRTEPKKSALTDAIRRHVDEVCVEASTYGIELSMPSDHDINEYLAEHTRALRKDYEELLREEHLRRQAEAVANELTRFHISVLAQALQHEKQTLNSTDDTAPILERIKVLQKKKAAVRYNGDVLLGLADEETT